MTRVALLDSDGVIVGIADVDDAFWNYSQPDIQAYASSHGLSSMILDPNEGSPSMNVPNLAAWHQFVLLAASSDSATRAAATVPPASAGSTMAAAAVGVATAAVVVGLFKAPLWAGLVLGAAGVVLTKAGIDKASEA